MPLIYQGWITREDLQANPKVFYVFGDNAKRRGLRGQAKEMRGEPNAIGIPTKWEPSMRPAAFFSDDNIDDLIALVQDDFAQVAELLRAGKTVVWPRDGIGTGLSKLPSSAPGLWAEFETARLKLEQIVPTMHVLKGQHNDHR